MVAAPSLWLWSWLSPWRVSQCSTQCQIWPYYAVKKVFVKFFAKFFEAFAKFFKVFASFGGFPEHFEAFGSIRTHWDSFGCIRKQLEAFGRFRIFLSFLGFLDRFSTFPDVNFTKDLFHGTMCYVKLRLSFPNSLPAQIHFDLFRY